MTNQTKNKPEDRAEPAQAGSAQAGPAQDRAGFLSHLSIRIKQHGLLALLVGAVTITMVLLLIDVSMVRSAISQQSEVLTTLEKLQKGAKQFGDMSYWYTDLTNSLSDASEEAATKAQADFIETVTPLSPLAPADIEKIIANANSIGEIAMNALDEYALEERANGNALMDQARILIQDSDSRIRNLVEQTQDQARAAATSVAAKTSTAMTVAIIGLVIILALGALMAVLSERFVINPLGRITTAIKKLANDEKNVAIPFTKNKDEIGAVANALQILQTNAQKFETMRQKEEERQQKQDQQTREKEAEKIEQERLAMVKQREQTLSLADLLEKKVRSALDKVTVSAGELETAARSMVETVDRSVTNASVVAVSSDEATQNVQTVAAATEELASAISEISRQVAKSTTMTSKAAENATRTHETIKGLAEASETIGNVIELINDISSRTNLLALNATIEAARAGEAGRGFSIVANEVKNLAVQSSEATEQIAEQISRIQSVTQTAVSEIDMIGKFIQDLDDIAGSISSSMEEQGSATSEIGRSVAEAAEGTRKVNESITEIAEASSQTGIKSNTVLKLAEHVDGLAIEVREAIDSYLEELRQSAA